MKKLTDNLQKLTLMLAVLFIGFGFTACSDDDEEGGTLIGTWRYINTDEHSSYYEEFTFNEDGTGSYAEGNQYNDDTCPITWNLSDGKITITYIWSFNSYTLTESISISGNVMILDGVRYVRVK